MATGSLQWTPWDAAPGDGAASNAGPALLAILGTETSPHKQVKYAAFDAATDEHLWFQFVMPSDYASGGTVKLQWMTNATTATTVRWGARIGAITPADADTPVEHAQATAVTGASSTNTTEARRLIAVSLDLTGNLDSVAAADLCFLLVYRDADGTSGTDDLAVDAELVSVLFEYTTI